MVLLDAASVDGLDYIIAIDHQVKNSVTHENLYRGFTGLGVFVDLVDRRRPFLR